MKRIFIIVCLLGLILNSFGQDEDNTDYLDVSTQITFRGDSLQKWVNDNAPSGTARDAGNGISLDGNAIDFGGSALNKDTELEGAGYSMSLGTLSSRLTNFIIYSTTGISLNTAGDFHFANPYNSWTLDGNHWISSSHDTLAQKSDINESIDANTPVLPFNFNYTFSSSVTDSRPGIGYFRLNNATLANVTEIYVDYFDANSVAKNDFIAMLDTGSVVSVITDVNNYALYKLTGGYVDNSNYYTYKVTYQSHSGVISGLSTIDLDISNSTGSGGGVSVDSLLISYTDTIEFTGDTLFADGTGNSTANSIKAKNLYATNNVDADTVISNEAAYFTRGLFAYKGIVGTTNYGFLDASELIIRRSGVNRLVFSPGNADGALNVNYIMDNEYDMVLGSLLDIRNQGTSVFKVTKDSILAENLALKARLAELDTLILNGTTVTEIQTSKFIMENTEVDSLDVSGYKIRFNASEGVHEFKTAKSGVVWQGALEDLVQVYNNTGQEIANGTPLFLGQALGDTIASAGIASAYTSTAVAFAGAATGTIADNSWGFCAIRGKVRGLNTSGLSISGAMFLGDSIFTMTKPDATGEVIIAGGVISVHASEGIIYISPSLALKRQIIAKGYNFTSNGVAAGTFYNAGDYDFATTSTTLTQAVTQDYGTSDIGYSAHVSVVTGGVGSVTGGGRVSLISTGTSITDGAVSTGADVDTLISDITTTLLDDYYEAKKYMGEFTLSLVIADGAPSAYSLPVNYGYAKYEDFGNRDFYLIASECIWEGGASDATGFDIEILHHKQTGWTYAASGFIPGDGAIAQRSVDQSGFLRVSSGIKSSWKRTELNTFIEGSASEGLVYRIKTGANGTIQLMNMHLGVALD